MKRKLYALLLAGVMTLSLAARGPNAAIPSDSGAEVSAVSADTPPPPPPYRGRGSCPCKAWGSRSPAPGDLHRGTRDGRGFLPPDRVQRL